MDLPPGTSDASLTTMLPQPVNEIVMVTTPKRLASMVVRKAVQTAQAIKTPILGVVENMAYIESIDPIEFPALLKAFIHAVPVKTRQLN